MTASRRMSHYDCQSIIPRITARLFVDAMRPLIIIAVLEIVAIIFAVALCVSARRADERTERALSRDEVETKRQPANRRPRLHPAPVHKRASWRWLTAIRRTGNHDRSGN